MSEEITATRNVVVINEGGLHTRAALSVARLVQQFDCRVELVRSSQRAEATDILQMLTLGAAAGTQLELEANGLQAEQALDALVKLFHDKFGED